MSLDVTLALDVRLTNSERQALSAALHASDFQAHLRQTLVREVEAVIGRELGVPLYDSRGEAYAAYERLDRLGQTLCRADVLNVPAFSLNLQHRAAAWEDWQAWKRADSEAAQAGALD